MAHSTPLPDGFSPSAFIIAAEQGEVESTEEYVDGVAALIRSNFIIHLQGSWQRAARHLVDAGIINQWGDVLCYPEES